MSIKILATADLHLGRRSSDINEDYGSTKFVLRRMVDYCIDREVHVVLLCGDIVDRDNRFFEAYGPLQEAFDRLGKNNIRVFLVAGNHDFDVLLQIINTGNNSHVYLLGRGGKWEVEKFTKGEEIIQFLGWSFPKQYVSESPIANNNFKPDGFDENLRTIGLLHCEVDSERSNYSPIPLSELVNTNIDLWVLGHIHKPEELSSRPPIWYTGSPQALSSKEEGIHGPLLITVSPNSSNIDIEQVSLSPTRYMDIDIDITGIENGEDFRAKVINDLNNYARSIETDLENIRSLIYSIRLMGESSLIEDIRIWSNTIKDYGDRIGNTRISIRGVKIQISPRVKDLQALAKQPSPAGILAKTILAIENKEDNEFLDDLVREWILRIRDINGLPAYNPLSIGRKLEINRENALASIKKESKNLLNELINQINN